MFTKYLSNGHKSDSKIIQMWNFMNAHNELGRRPKNVLFSMWNLDQFLLQRFGKEWYDPLIDLDDI